MAMPGVRRSNTRAIRREAKGALVLAVEGRRLATGVHDTLRCEGGTQPEVFRPEVHNPG